MSSTQLAHSAAAFNGESRQSQLGRNSLLSALESFVCPAALVLALGAVTLYFEGALPPEYLILGVMVFALTFPGHPRVQMPLPSVLLDIAFNWVWIAALLALTGFATGYYRDFSSKALWAWLWLAPLTEVAATMALRAAAPYLLTLQGPKQRAIIVGINAQGKSLANTIEQARFSRTEFCGFIDSRSTDRVSPKSDCKLIGTLSELATVVQRRRIQLIYLSLPMSSLPRILQILDDLKDTTASIYFVPDMFVTDLIQGQAHSVNGIPVISVCESPFRGFAGVVKRLSDVLFSLAILALIFPVLLAIACAIKYTSKGPVIFKQRRYGLDGEEILVYKFRSMRVTEDGGAIAQATRNDARITPLGAFLRRTSLDELPQFINVLQGRMSIVGPRPHAVAHNELYRKLIKGYMVRHKVKPGITGWAQVNGFRGETETLDKMQGRIDYDLDYLRHWSLQLDVHIILKTVRVVVHDRHAY